ncbi:TonB-dependent receptor [Chitinophaga sp. Mgbs1]|uniref:TonB-dependent receptor n=1 Tax=Chitinophaga solisilvae TaxID=1233460 RepID=A0A433W8N0_9BACT|nr:TonB-dependent receptor [Chitinophaga solisilvae]
MPKVTIVAKPLVEAIKLDSFSAVTAVVSQAQLRDLNAVDLASALRRTPGVQIARYNPVGAFGGDQGGAIFIRGMGASRPGSEIKTYINGLPFYMGLFNHPILDILPINGMQNITVYKSPQPQISGNNFASISLHTADPVADTVALQGNLRVSGGMFGTFVEQANLTGRTGKLDFGIAQGFARSNGHRSNASGTLRNVMANVGTEINIKWRAEIHLLYVNNLAKDPGDNRAVAPAIAPQYNTDAGMLSAGVVHHYKNVQGEIQLYTNRGVSSWLYQPPPDSNGYYHFNMSGIRWKETIQPWKGGSIFLNLDYDHLGGKDITEASTPAAKSEFKPESFNLVSPNVGISQNLALATNVTIRPSAGIRFYKHNTFHSKWAPYAGLSTTWKQLTVFGNISRGINYPGLEAPLLSLLIPPLGDTWKSLQPETVDHIEAGVQWIPVAITEINLSLFSDKIKNRYIFGFPPVLSIPEFVNLGNYTMKGLELSLRQTIVKQWQFFAGLTLLDPSISNLPYAPKTAITAGINGRIGPVAIVFDGQSQSKVWALNKSRSADATNTEQIDGFTVVNTRISYVLPVLGQQGEAFVNVENLFNERYAYRPGYPMPGIWFQAGVSASFSKLRLN